MKKRLKTHNQGKENWHTSHSGGGGVGGGGSFSKLYCLNVKSEFIITT